MFDSNVRIKGHGRIGNFVNVIFTFSRGSAVVEKYFYSVNNPVMC